MFVVRPVLAEDLDQLYKLSGLAEAGLTTLPHDREVLQRKIKESIRSFESIADRPGDEVYLFVLEDLDKKRVIGTSAIYAKVGGFQPFYTYKVQTITIASKMLKVKKDIRYLQLVIDHNGPTEIGTLFLLPEYRKEGLGRLLSLSRFLFIAQYRQCFEKDVIAEMRGVFDENNRSPFWESLGKHFFEVEFKKADLFVSKDKTFIADLMPKHPIYIPLLPAKVQQIIGKVHENTQPALYLLEKEGFRYKGEIDIFEAGPLVNAKVDSIRTVRLSQRVVVTDVRNKVRRKTMYLIANVDSFKDFRVAMGSLDFVKTGVLLTADIADALNLTEGSKVRVAPLKSSNKIKYG